MDPSDTYIRNVHLYGIKVKKKVEEHWKWVSPRDPEGEKKTSYCTSVEATYLSVCNNDTEVLYVQIRNNKCDRYQSHSKSVQNTPFYTRQSFGR
jgi:hypothetical protein